MTPAERKGLELREREFAAADRAMAAAEDAKREAEREYQKARRAYRAASEALIKYRARMAPAAAELLRFPRKSE